MKLIEAKCTLLILFLLAFLCSCKNQNTSENEWHILTENEHTWEVTNTTYPDADIYMTCYLSGNNSLIYISGDSKEYIVHKLSLSDETEDVPLESVNLLEFPEISEQTASFLLRIYPDYSDSDYFWGLWKSVSDNETCVSYELVRHNSDGASALIVEFNNSEITNALSSIPSAVIWEDCIYLLTEEQLIIAATTGTVCKIEDLKLKGTTQFVLVSGKLYLADMSSGEQTVLNALSYNGLSSEKITLPLGGSVLASEENGELYLSGAVSFFVCRLSTMTAEHIFDWSDIGIQSDGIKIILAAASDKIYLLYYDNGYTLLTLTKVSDTTDNRISITFMANQYDEDVIRFVSAFNESNQQYIIKIIDPGYSLYDDETLQTKIQLILTSDNCPDIVDLRSVTNWRNYVENDAFEDLTKFSAASDVLSTEDYLPNILKLGEAAGRQIFFPYAFNLEMLYGLEEYVGTDLDWSFEDILYLKDRYPDISLFNYSSDMTLECLMRMGLAEFVDNSDKTCSFEQELFYRILRISAASEHTFLEDSANISFFYDIVNKRCLLEPTTLTIPESFLMFQTKVSLSSGNTGVLALKGIPSSDGQAGAWLDARGPRYAIPSNSSNKEGAWQFIEYVLLCDSGTVYESLYLPARTDELLNRLQNIRPQILGDDEISELPEWTEEYNESFYAIIENAYEDRTDDVIYEIILEEAQYYFNGVKTEQEVAKVIQNRIQLYLSE